MGTLFIISLAIIIVMGFTLLLTLVESRHKCFRKCKKYLKPKVFWALPIQTFLESCMIIALCALLTMQHPNDKSHG